MLKMLWSTLGVKGSLFALLGLGLTVGGVYGWGYFSGYQSYKDKAQSLREAILQKQREEDHETHRREIKLALTKQRADYERQAKIRAIKRPDGSCELSDDSLRWIDDILGAATTDLGGTAPPPTE